MIHPEDFSYITSLHVNDCYPYQNFDIQLHEYKPFSHLILTGKNGSGESTILRNIHSHVVVWQSGNNLYATAAELATRLHNRKGQEGESADVVDIRG